ncbi:glycosyltransferase family 1 protein [Chroococcidiopsis sp. CCMEE 29]|uniref:glycosyltransferase family 1 protein n=1 Tax=Chroococcidiopsis sp. CCMEE 29 TaxID=155894 RepID=UPI00202219D5|nr:glycosyltransferase family 1 protein [Chroococcidiopsis sp. CCMEE 29]
MLVISIVPRLFPVIDGVGDYALQLAQQLRKDFSIETHFIVGDPNWNGSTKIEGFPIDKLPLRSALELSSLLLNCCPNSTIVLLHYVGYGYATKGCPFWLIEGLEHWKANTVNTELVTMVHELHPSGDPPWRINFWLSWLQKHLAARIARLSDRCLTNRQSDVKALYNLSRGKHTQIPTLPVFSNIGEPKSLPSLSERQRRLVVFGQENSRLRVYQKSLKQLSQACQVLGIEEIWDIGPSIKLNLAAVSEVPIVKIGKISASEVSDIMLNSSAGFFNYDISRLSKSGIFAAYCSHKLLPISYHYGASSFDGIEAGKHYWVPESEHLSVKSAAELQAIADNAYTWYQNHNLSVQAKTFAKSLGGNLITQSGERN